MKLPLSPPPSLLILPAMLALGTLSSQVNAAQPEDSNPNKPANPGKSFPPGLAKRVDLPPGLANNDNLPPGLDNKTTEVTFLPVDPANSDFDTPAEPVNVVVRRIK